MTIALEATASSATEALLDALRSLRKLSHKPPSRDRAKRRSTNLPVTNAAGSLAAQVPQPPVAPTPAERRQRVDSFLANARLPEAMRQRLAASLSDAEQPVDENSGEPLVPVSQVAALVEQALPPTLLTRPPFARPPRSPCRRSVLHRRFRSRHRCPSRASRPRAAGAEWLFEEGGSGLGDRADRRRRFLRQIP